MTQLIGLDFDKKLIYEAEISDVKEASEFAKKILEMDHIFSVIAIENVPNVFQNNGSFHISYHSRFLFMIEKDKKV